MSPKSVPLSGPVLAPSGFLCGCGEPAEVVIDAQPTPVTACRWHAEALRRAVPDEIGRAHRLVSELVGEHWYCSEVNRWCVQREDGTWIFTPDASVAAVARQLARADVTAAKSRVARAEAVEQVAKARVADERAALVVARAAYGEGGVSSTVGIASQDRRLALSVGQIIETMPTIDILLLAKDAGLLGEVTS